MKGLPANYNGNVIVGMESSDDAGIYRLSDSEALVQTVDYITPIVDDPFTFGRIAACNSLSDVYAMGGRPITALNIVCFPVDKFTMEVLATILKGGLSALEEAETQLLGGHSVNDPELKYGLAVTGIVRQLESSGEAEIASENIGELVMEALKSLDDVAYVRYASVYRNFREARDFHELLGELKGEDEAG